ncbi:MAG TPA: xylulokinase [Candidatus Limiplasma sp.]|nr:xylulokinase [Candidatus Limiplasma sp.]HRX09670.1 xylulokinase [Candidatus Limiplasma sp.]
MSAYLLGIDIGTSACKVALFLEDGRVAAQDTREYAVYYPQPGWAEQDPMDWWQAVCTATRQVLSQSGIQPGDIAGIGIDGQSWSAIAVDGQGAPLCKTPIWTDTRARRECEEITGKVSGDALFALCGNPVQPSYTLPKILWYKNNRPEVYQNAQAILQSNSFIAYQLTGRITQDVSQGYGLCCFDMRRKQWDMSVAQALGIRPELLPELFDSHQVIGAVTPQAAKATGLLAGTPVVAGGLDAACGTLGAGVIEPGQTQEQGGQAGGMSLCIDQYAADPRLILGTHVVPGRWLLQGGTTGGGGALKWLRETMCPELSYGQMDELAAQAPAGCDGVIFLPYMAGERSPIWNPNASGVFFGLNYAKTRAHLIRAVMEGVGFALRHNLEVAQDAGAYAHTLRSVGGSSNSRLWTQIKADITGHAIHVPASDTAATLGAAILAGVGTGVYQTFASACHKTVKITRMDEPDAGKQPIYDARYAQYRELYTRLEPMMTGNDQ